MPGVVGTAELANRRGFLIGLTIAEVMLITLFVLLLLFRHTQEQAQTAQLVQTFLGEPGVVAIQKNSTSSSIHAPMRERLDDIMQELIDCRLENDPACINYDDKGAGEPPVFEPEPLPEPQSIEDAMQQISDLQKELAKKNGQIKKLVETSVPGDIPFCTYEGRALRANALRGPSISVGTFLIEPDGVTLLERNQRFFGEDIVDYNGLDYDTTAAGKAIRSWPLGQKLTLASFEQRAQEFIDIGDIETETHKKCRFGGLYYYETSDDNLRVFNTIFQNYFFLGSRERITKQRAIDLKNSIEKQGPL